MAQKINQHSKEFMEELENCTLPQILARQAQTLGNREVAIREKAYGIWQTYTWKDYYDYVKYTSLGMMSLGLKRNDNVGIVMDNHPEWLFSELGAQAAGAVSLNLFTSAITSELVSALRRIHASFVIAQDQEQVDKIIEKRGDLPHLIKIIYVDPTGMRTYRDNTWLMSFAELLEIGREYEAQNPGHFESEIEKSKPDETALMIMTSGTTGIAKLAMLSHRNFISMAKKWLATEPIGIGSNWMSMSPPAWIVDQMWGAGVTLVGGMVMNFPETIDTIIEDFREIGPSIIITSSRFWEDLASKIRVKMDDAGFINRKLFALAEKIGSAMVECEAQRKPAPYYLKILNALATLIIFNPLLDRVGCSGFVSAFTGGHPISPDVIRFFRAVGVNLKQCYGLTESCGIFQIQPDNEVKLETVGKPLPGIDVKISDDQEVMVLSDTAFAGYYNDYEATEEAFNDGWLLTGDAGYFDDDGHLLIIGRKQDIIRDKKGNAFSPDFIETRLKFSLFIKEAVTFGEARPYITALVNIDMGNVGNWAEERMIPYTTYTDLSQISQVEDLIHEEIREVNTQLPDPMRIRKFILLYKLLDADDEELTRTGKVRRRFVYGLYLDMIEAMYSGKDNLEVEGKVRYRDGHVGMIKTTVNVITVD